MKFSVVWAMPNKWTFQVPPIRAFVDRWVHGAQQVIGQRVIDPFAGTSHCGTHLNDLTHDGGEDAEEYCKRVLRELGPESFNVVIFDPPYSPRQISECYKSIGRPVTTEDTQNARLYARVRQPLSELLKHGGIALSFGWQSCGFGRAWTTEEIMLVQHGGAHNDTICVAQRKSNVKQETLWALKGVQDE